ncbi:putative Alpha/beta hydrolase fold protein [Microbacterium sp. C448]|uniref:alpha/beta fold hydrolase n=1 Tax=Microbacterium TaxID=33882 RepID=UPI0003DE3BF5|nr:MULTISPECIES: alpha/beta hydrolase [Microbacterium]CDJ99818.1 putative Alpha/beta hydrolase fold protein [Microbacterium sp. C448]
MKQLLLFPGMAQDARAYDLTGFPQEQAYVYPGHGGRESQVVTLDGLADEALRGRVDRLDLVGVALGGIIAQHVMVQHPHRVRSAVLANTPAGVSNRSPLIERAEATAATGPQVDELIARWLRPSTIADDGEAVRYLREVLETISWDGLANVQRAMADHDLVTALEGNTYPVTVIIGEDDYVGIGAAERLAALFVNHRVRRIPGGHMVHLDNPRGFRETVLEHVEWVDDLERAADGARESERRSA